MVQQQERRTGKRIVFALLLVLLFVLAAVGGFVAMGGLSSLPFFKKAPTAYFAAEPLKVLRLAAPAQEGDVPPDEAMLRDTFTQAADYAEANGFNTLVFDAKQGLSVWWRDKRFPPAGGVEVYDRGRNKLDALAVLCEVLQDRDIQLWLEIRPYEGGTLDVEAKNAAAKLLAPRGGAVEAFTAADTDYLGLLAESLAALPMDYPIAGVVLAGFDDAAQSDAFADGLRDFVTRLHTAMADGGHLLPLGLSYSESGGAVSPGLARNLKREGLLTYLLPAVSAGPGAVDAIAAYDAIGTGLVLQEPLNDDGLVLFSASRSAALSGVLYGGWPAAAADADRYAFLSASLRQVEGPMPQGFDIPNYLAVNYPAQNAGLYTEEVYVMGNSDPTQPLLLDGAEVTGRAPKGSFGVAVPLEVGENSFTFSQGDKELTLKVTRKTAAGGGGTATYPQDHTQEAPEGQAIQVVTTIANALTKPGDGGEINETLQNGAVFICDGSAKGIRWNSATGQNETSWYYRMKSGDYVPAVNCTWVNNGTASFTGITASSHEAGEYLDFEGFGTPAAYIKYDDENNTLILTFEDTELTVPSGFSSELVAAASVEKQDGSTILTLSVPDIWGYLIEYTDNGTHLFLKRPPQRSGNPAQPLAFVRVLLDPGHGDTDIGAAGVMGGAGPPNEKDMNLAQAQAIAYRLRQLGATVEMTRNDDTFYTLEERLQMQNDFKPDFFLAVHHNSVELDRDRSDAKGVEGYYYHPYSVSPSKQFAQNLIDYIAAGSGRTPRHDATWYPFYVTRTTVCPSVLFEYGFVVCPTEFEDITSTEGLYAVAFATADGLLATLPQ